MTSILGSFDGVKSKKGIEMMFNTFIIRKLDQQKKIEM